MGKARRQATQRTSFVLPRELHERLQAEHERTGASLAEIVRRAVDAYLTPREQAARKGAGR